MATGVIAAVAIGGHRYDDFLSRWHTLAGQFSTAAQRFHGNGLRTDPAGDTVNALLLAGATDDLDKARNAVTDAAKRAGLATCAQIPWKYWKP